MASVKPIQSRYKRSNPVMSFSYKAFRTKLVISWIISNLALVAVITNAQLLHWFGDFAQRSTGYLGFILWSVAGLSAFRFIGTCLYLVFKIFTG
jgi:chitin synthase